jgi:hypothetical protein
VGDGTLLIVSSLFGRAIVVLAALSIVLGSAESAFAGGVAVPGPPVGAGLPGLAVFGGVYGAIWLTRKLRGRRGTE